MLHPDYAKLQVAVQILESQFMHKLIREKGGAYGAFVSCESNGSCSLVSYRDPNYLKTYVNFEQAVSMLMNRKFTE